MDRRDGLCARFAILTMCRALYTLACGEVVSKPQAAAWAREALGTPWVQLIDRALLWRHDTVWRPILFTGPP